MPIILITIGLILIICNYRFIKKQDNLIDDKSISNNDFSFKNILQENKNELDDYKIEIGILRKDIAESLTELQEEILEIKNNLNMVKKDEDVYENKEYVKNYNILDKDNDIDNIEDYNKEISENEFLINSHANAGVISDINFSKKEHNAENNKTESIKNLLQEGLTDEEICHKLSVSKGEILLVKNLFKK